LRNISNINIRKIIREKWFKEFFIDKNSYDFLKNQFKNNKWDFDEFFLALKNVFEIKIRISEDLLNTEEEKAIFEYITKNDDKNELNTEFSIDDLFDSIDSLFDKKRRKEWLKEKENLISKYWEKIAKMIEVIKENFVFETYEFTAKNFFNFYKTFLVYPLEFLWVEDYVEKFIDESNNANYFAKWKLWYVKHIIIDEIVFLKTDFSSYISTDIWYKSIIILTAQNIKNNFLTIYKILWHESKKWA